MKKITDNPIYLIERNIRGAWAVFGIIGVRQYYYYTKSEAKKRYLAEVKSKVVFNEKPKRSK